MVATEIDDPPLRAGTARVRVARCGICGSDLHARENPRYRQGSVLGHEIVGEIVETGEGAGDWVIGDRVALYHGVSCGQCEMCRSGNSHLCFNALSTSLGLGAVQGGYAELITVPYSILHRIPEGLGYDDAAIAEPLSISIHGVNQARVAAGDPVCVLGAGPIGAMAACALRVRGIDDLVIVDPNPLRRAKMAELGFTAVDLDGVSETVPDALGGSRPRAVLECSGHVSAASLAVELSAYTGRVVLQGVPREPVPVSQFSVVQKEVELVGAASCTQQEFAEAIDYLAAGRIPAERLVTAVVGFGRTEELFNELLSPANTQMKVLLDPAKS